MVLLTFYSDFLVIKPGAATGGRLVNTSRIASDVITRGVGVPTGIYHIGIVLYIVIAYVVVAARSS